MTNPLRITVAALALLAAQPALAQKFGYVDLQRALNEVEEGRVAKAQLKRDFDEKQKQLDAKQDELKRLKADFDKQASLMNEQVKKDKNAELERKFMDLQQTFVALQKDLSEREREATAGIFRKMEAIVREIAEADGFTFVFERNDSGLLYAPASLDLTNELIRKYNAKNPGGGVKPAAASKPAEKPAAAAPKK